VVTAPPAASLASELVRLLPELRALVGPDRRATVVFDRGGWSATTFAAIRAAGFDLLTYRKGPFDRLADSAFTAHSYADSDGQVRSYRLAETTVELPLSNRTGGSVALRQIHRQAVDGTQIPVLTSRTDLPAAEVCWRLSARWRQENYFKYARAHFALCKYSIHTWRCQIQVFSSAINHLPHHQVLEAARQDVLHLLERLPIRLRRTIRSLLYTHPQDRMVG